MLSSDSIHAKLITMKETTQYLLFAMILKPQRNSLFALTMSYSSRIIETSDSSSFLVIFKFFSKPFISQLLICYYEVRIQESGAPNENIVQNHLNIALSNIF